MGDTQHEEPVILSETEARLSLSLSNSLIQANDGEPPEAVSWLLLGPLFSRGIRRCAS